MLRKLIEIHFQYFPLSKQKLQYTVHSPFDKANLLTIYPLTVPLPSHFYYQLLEWKYPSIHNPLHPESTSLTSYMNQY